MRLISFFWRRHRVALVVLVTALCAALWFGARLAREAVHFADPAHQRQTLEGWMTPRYVGRSWDLPPDVIMALMELQPGDGRRTLARIAAERGLTLAELEARVRAARAALDSAGSGTDPAAEGGLDDATNDGAATSAGQDD